MISLLKPVEVCYNPKNFLLCETLYIRKIKNTNDRCTTEEGLKTETFVIIFFKFLSKSFEVALSVLSLL